MQLIDLTPAALAEWPGFVESVEALRGEVELKEFSARAASFDVAQYEELYRNGKVRLMAVVGNRDKLYGWASVMTVTRPARADGVVLQIDAMWAEPATPAGAVLMKEIKEWAGVLAAPIVATAPIGGRLDSLLTRSKNATRTHHVYVIR